jgi:hypothetical protein
MKQRIRTVTFFPHTTVRLPICQPLPKNAWCWPPGIITAAKHSRIFTRSFPFLHILVTTPFVVQTCVQVQAIFPRKIVRFQVLTAESMKFIVFWVVAPCSLVEDDRRFRGAYCLHNLTNTQGVISITSISGIPYSSPRQSKRHVNRLPSYGWALSYISCAFISLEPNSTIAKYTFETDAADNSIKHQLQLDVPLRGRNGYKILICPLQIPFSNPLAVNSACVHI